MDFEGEITHALSTRASLPMLRDIVQRYKQRGGTQQHAYDTLEKIRQAYRDAPCEDLVLDLMDCVAGFCSKDQRIWDEVLTG